MANFANLTANLNLNIQNFTAGMRRASTQVSQFSNNMRGTINGGLVAGAKKAGIEFKDVARIVQGIMISKVFYGGLNSIKQCVSAVWDFSQQLEYAKIAYSNLFGDTALAEEFINVLKDFAATTPFTFQESEAAAKRLLAYGVQYKNVMYVMQGALAASSMQGNPQVIEQVSRALGQIYTKGRLMNEEMRQLAEAGIPAYEILRDKLGLTQKQLQNLGREAIPASKAINALVDGMNERFGNVIKASSKTLKGVISNIKDNASMLMASIFEPLTNKLKNMLNIFGQLLFKMRDIQELRGLGGVFEALFPPDLHATIRAFVANLMNLWTVLKIYLDSAFRLLNVVILAFIQVMNTIGPIVTSVLGVLGRLIQSVTQNATAMRYLTNILAIAAAMWVVFKVKALATMIVVGVCKAITTAIGWITTALTFVMVHPVWALLIAITGIVVGLSGGFGKLSDMVTKFFKSLTKINGYDPDKLLLPSQKERAKDLDKFNEKLEGTKDGMDDLADSTGKATKAAKGLLSFDEVFKLNQPDEGAGDGGIDGGIDGDINGDIDDMPDFEMPDIPGIGGDDLMPGIPDFGSFAKDFVDSLYESLKDSLLAMGIGALLGALLGGLLGGPLGAAIGAVVGAIAGYFWNKLADALGLTPEEKIKAAITLGIGTILGAIIGGILGGPMGAKIGAVIGTIAGALWGLIAQALGVTDAQQIITVIMAGISGALAGVAKHLAGFTLVNTLDGAFAGFARNIGLSLKDSIKFGIKGALVSLGVGLLSNALVAWIANELDLTAEDVKNASTGQIIGNIIGSITGMILGGPMGSIVGGAIGQLAGSIVGEFWAYLSTTLKGSIIGGVAGLPIGALIGTLVGAIGGPLGAAIGAAIGAALGALVGVIIEYWDVITKWFSDIGIAISEFFANFGTNVETFWNNLTTNISNWTSETWNTFTTWLSELGPKMREGFMTLMNDMGYALGKGVGHIVKFAIDASKEIQKFFTETIPKAWQTFKASWNTFWSVTFPEVLNSIWAFFTEAGKAFIAFFTETIPKAWEAFKEGWNTFWSVTFPNVLNSIGQFFIDAGVSFINFFTTVIPNAWNSFKLAWINFWEVTFPEVLSSIGSFFNVLWNNFVTWGSDVIKGFVEGFRSAWNFVWEAIGEFFNGFIQGFKDVFGMHSPASTTRPLGENTILGFVQGMLGAVEGLLITIAEIGATVIMAIGEWFIGIGTNIATWSAETMSLISTWASETALTISTWVSDRVTDFINWSTTTSTNFGAWVTDTSSKIGTWVTDTAGKFAGWITDTTAKIASWSSTTISNISSWVSTISNSIDNWVSSTASKFASFVSDSIAKFSNFVSTTVSNISSWASSVSSTASSAMSTFKTNVSNGMSSALNSISNFCSNALSKISSWASSFGSWISNAISSAASAVSSAVSSFSSKLSGGSSSQRTGHATGGVFNREHVARFAEGNKAEAVIPLENASAMQPFVDAVSNGISASLMPIMANFNSGSQSQLQPVYVGTLIADERGLKELQRKMQIIQLQEDTRRGF